MLAQFRAFAKSPVANVLLGLILVSFLFVGGRSVLNAAGASKDAVVRAGGRTVTSAQFRQMFGRALQRLSQQNNNQPITAAEAIKNDVDRRLLDEVSQEESLSAWIARIGVRPGDKLIADELHKQPQLFNPVSGVFDKAAYQQILQQNGLTAPEFEAGLRDQIAQTHVLTGLVSGLQAPAAYSALEAVFRQEGRSFTWFALPASAVPAPPAPTEAELQAYLRDNAANLTRPATRRVSLVRFSASLLAPSLPVDEAQARKRFDFEKDTLSTPEKRSFVQLAAASPAQAARLLKGLAAGEDPAAVATAAKSPAPAIHADQPRSAVADATVAAAVFAMRPGEVRQVQGSLGPAVVKLQGVTPGHDATFEEARPKVEAEVRRAEAVAKAGALSQTYDDARQGGADLAEAARRAGVAVTPVPEFDAQGHDGRGQPVPVPPKLVQTAFALAQGGTSEVLEAVPGQGEFYAIRVDAAKPAAPYTVDEVRAPLTRQLKIQALARALKARGDALAAQIKAGQPVAAVAASAGAQAASATVRRDQAQQQPTFGTQLLGQVFAGKPGDVVLAPDPRGAGLLVARVDAVRQADPGEAGRAAQALRRTATTSLYEDVAVNARSAAAALIRPKSDPVLARRAAGGDAGGRRAGRTLMDADGGGEVRPDPDAFAAAYARGEPQLVWTRVVDDLETPVSAFLKLGAGRAHAGLFESVEGGAWRGRYSIIVRDPDLVWRARGEAAEVARGEAAVREGRFTPEPRPTLASLRALVDEARLPIPSELPPMAAGLFGVLGYDTVRLAEPLGPPPPDPLDLPDAVLLRPQLVAIFDGVFGEILLVTPVRPSARTAQDARAAALARLDAARAELARPVAPAAAPSPPAREPELASPMTRADYRSVVEAAKRYIEAGDIFQVVPSQRFSGPAPFQPFAFYRALRRLNPSPFLYYLDLGGFQLAGSSPEILVRYRDDRVTLRPIAGTRRRGATPDEDAALERELLADPKERAEHLMLLDLGRNDVGRALRLGEDGANVDPEASARVRVTQSFAVERYSHVMHIVSNVEGAASRPLDPVDVILAALPAGTLSGAPKVRAMQIIDELEPVKRGVGYGGASGYISSTGEVDTCIVLRTALFKDGAMHVQAGGGVVADSDGDAEYEETLHKSRALARAAAQAWRFER